MKQQQALVAHRTTHFLLFPWDTMTHLAYLTYLVSFDVPVPHPLAELGAPVLEHVGFCELLTLSVAESALSLRGCDEMYVVEVDLQPLLRLHSCLLFGAPRATVVLRAHSAQNKITQR